MSFYHIEFINDKLFRKVLFLQAGLAFPVNIKHSGDIKGLVYGLKYSLEPCKI